MLLIISSVEHAVGVIWISDLSLYLTRCSIDILSDGPRAPMTCNFFKSSWMSNGVCLLSNKN